MSEIQSAGDTTVKGAGWPRVVIVGGGFGGLEVARALAGEDVLVTLIDRRNHHLFQPLLYQVATASLSPADIAAPIRAILRQQANLRVLLAQVERIDPVVREVHVEGEAIAYDYLILATGVSHSYFGHDEWARLAPGLKSLEDALEIRRRILLAFEAAERSRDEAERDRQLSFVVVGGGPTGVELAGALAEISRHSLARDFDSIDPAEARIYLLEAGPRLLSTFAEKLATRATEDLQRLGVTVRTGAMVTGIDATGVTVGEADHIPAATVLWGAGVRAEPLAASLRVPLDRAGRVQVRPDLSVAEYPEILVIGDLAALAGQDGRQLPGVAPVAQQQGRLAAANILARIAGEPPAEFRYRDRGNMATIGRNHAIAEIGPLKLTGFLAWSAWLFVHIVNLIGFRNRLIVMTQWLWSYLTYQRGARLITRTAQTEIDIA